MDACSAVSANWPGPGAEHRRNQGLFATPADLLVTAGFLIYFFIYFACLAYSALSRRRLTGSESLLTLRSIVFSLLSALIGSIAAFLLIAQTLFG